MQLQERQFQNEISVIKFNDWPKDILSEVVGCMRVARVLLQLAGGGTNPCEDLVPGHFDWHDLHPKDPYPAGEFGTYSYCPG